MVKLTRKYSKNCRKTVIIAKKSVKNQQKDSENNQQGWQNLLEKLVKKTCKNDKIDWKEQ